MSVFILMSICHDVKIPTYDYLKVLLNLRGGKCERVFWLVREMFASLGGAASHQQEAVGCQPPPRSGVHPSPPPATRSTCTQHLPLQVRTYPTTVDRTLHSFFVYTRNTASLCFQGFHKLKLGFFVFVKKNNVVPISIHSWI